VVLTWTNATDDDLRGVRIMRRTIIIRPVRPTVFWFGRAVASAIQILALIIVLPIFIPFLVMMACLIFFFGRSGAKTLATPCSGSCSNSSPGTAPINAPSEPDNTPPLTATDMVAVAGDGQVSLTWTNPFNDLDWYGTVIVRKLGSYPASYSDGILVYSGTGSSYTDTGVNNGTTYYMAFTL
jgi:hypothetical protein